MACRSLLLKLQARGLITLPPRQRPSVNARRNQRSVAVWPTPAPIQAPLEYLGVERGAGGVRQCRGQALESSAPAVPLPGHRNCVGENLKYLVRDGQRRALACGCSVRQPAVSLPRCVHRLERAGAAGPPGVGVQPNPLLLLPWVRVPGLASHLLGRMTRRLSHDWQARYGHRIHLSRPSSSGTVSRAPATGPRAGSAWGRPPVAGATAPPPTGRSKRSGSALCTPTSADSWAHERHLLPGPDRRLAPDPRRPPRPAHRLRTAPTPWRTSG